MPRITWLSTQREADKDAYRQKEFVRVLTNCKVDGVSHQSIAINLGVAPATISGWKKNSGNMSLKSFRKLVEVASVSDDDILRIIRGRKSDSAARK